MKIDYFKHFGLAILCFNGVANVSSSVNCKSLNNYNFDFYEGNEKFFFPVLRISFLSRLRTPIHTGWKAV